MDTKRQMLRMVREAREELAHARNWLRFYALESDFGTASDMALNCKYWQGVLATRQEQLAEQFPKRNAVTVGEMIHGENATIRQLAQNGQRFEAIRQYRLLYNTSLIDARDAVDAMKAA